jgi:hypothetical protein
MRYKIKKGSAKIKNFKDEMMMSCIANLLYKQALYARTLVRI